METVCDCVGLSGNVYLKTSKRFTGIYAKRQSKKQIYIFSVCVCV